MIATLVIHVRGNAVRRAYIERVLHTAGLEGTYITDGNCEDLTPEILDRYFAGDMHGQFPRTSCAYKHVLAARYIVEHHLDGALVLEDDIRLFADFRDIFRRSLQEIAAAHQAEPLIANYEESSLLLVPRSRRRKQQVLYPAQRDRFTGCMYVTREAAQAMLIWLDTNKITEPVDRWHSALVAQGLMTYYWSHPCAACQCSADGTMPTMIPTKPRTMQRLKWLYKRAYKHLLYQLR